MIFFSCKYYYCTRSMDILLNLIKFLSWILLAWKYFCNFYIILRDAREITFDAILKYFFDESESFHHIKLLQIIVNLFYYIQMKNFAQQLFETYVNSLHHYLKKIFVNFSGFIFVKFKNFSNVSFVILKF